MVALSVFLKMATTMDAHHLCAAFCHDELLAISSSRTVFPDFLIRQPPKVGHSHINSGARDKATGFMWTRLPGLTLAWQSAATLDSAV